MNEYFETYRGAVMPVHCDVVEHMTIASYYERLADAYVSFTERMGLGAEFRKNERRAFAAVRTFSSLKQELRAGDTLHMEGGVAGVGVKPHLEALVAGLTADFSQVFDLLPELGFAMGTVVRGVAVHNSSFLSR